MDVPDPTRHDRASGCAPDRNGVLTLEIGCVSFLLARLAEVCFTQPVNFSPPEGAESTVIPTVHDSIYLTVGYAYAGIERRIVKPITWAAPRRRPKRVAKKLAQRKSVRSFADFDLLTGWLR